VYKTDIQSMPGVRQFMRSQRQSYRRTSSSDIKTITALAKTRLYLASVRVVCVIDVARRLRHCKCVRSSSLPPHDISEFLPVAACGRDGVPCRRAGPTDARFSVVVSRPPPQTAIWQRMIRSLIDYILRRHLHAAPRRCTRSL